MLPRTHSLVSSLSLLLSVALAALSAAPRDAADGFSQINLKDAASGGNRGRTEHHCKGSAEKEYMLHGTARKRYVTHGAARGSGRQWTVSAPAAASADSGSQPQLSPGCRCGRPYACLLLVRRSQPSETLTGESPAEWRYSPTKASLFVVQGVFTRGKGKSGVLVESEGAKTKRVWRDGV